MEIRESILLLDRVEWWFNSDLLAGGVFARFGESGPVFKDKTTVPADSWFDQQFQRAGTKRKAQLFEVFQDDFFGLMKFL